MWRCCWSGSEFICEPGLRAAAFVRPSFGSIDSLINIFTRLLPQKWSLLRSGWSCSFSILVWLHPAAIASLFSWEMEATVHATTPLSSVGKQQKFWDTDSCSAQLQVEVMLWDSEQLLCTAHWWKRAQMIAVVAIWMNFWWWWFFPPLALVECVFSFLSSVLWL